MSELDTIKLFFKFLFEKYNHLELGIRYEYDALSNDHMIEISNEALFQLDDFKLESFEFAMSFIEKYSEFVLFLKPSDPVHIGRVDYSENNFYKKDNYVSSQIIEGFPILLDKLINVTADLPVNTNPKPLSVVTVIQTSTKQFYSTAA